MADNAKDDKKKKMQAGEETPEVYAVKHAGGKPTLSRRSFLELAALAVGSTALPGGIAATAEAAQPRPALAHSAPVLALALNPSGHLLASGDKKGTIKLWQLPEGVLIHSWSGYDKPIQDLAFPNAEDTLWSLDSTGKLKRWHLPDGKQITDTKFLRASRLLAVAAGGDWFTVKGSRNEVERRSQTSAEKLGTVKGLADTVSAMAASADGLLLLVGGKNGNLGVWDQSGANHVQTVKAGPTAVSVLTMDSNGKLGLSIHGDGHLMTWGLPGLSDEAAHLSKLGKLFCAAIRPQLDLFAAGSKKGDIGLWNLAAAPGAPKLLKGHTAAVRGTAITPDGSLLISGSEDKTIRLWSLPDGTFLRNLVDLKSNTKHVKGMSYKGEDVYGRTVSFTLPCGSPIPAGAVCTCNCVPGAMTIPKNHKQRYDSRGVCTCDLICTCNSVCTCQGVGSGRYVSYWYPN